MGYRPADWDAAYSSFYREELAPPSKALIEAKRQSPFPAGALPPIEQAFLLKNDGYTNVETGFTLEPDGSARVAVLTPMPGIEPVMWDWWFAWHGSHDNRYKLWHPKAHRSARWKDGQTKLNQYVGRTSLIEEYIGKNLEKAAIQFISPATIGLPNTQTGAPAQTVYICARVGYSHFPLNVGWLTHQIRSTPTGAEMRSRFWMGGNHIQLRWKGAIAHQLSKLLQKTPAISAKQASDLMVHCSEEMNHLAAFLPQLYSTFNSK